MSDLLVSPEWLAERLGHPDVKVVDGSWHLPALKRDAKAEFRQGHIPGAVFFDIDSIADLSTDLPHMLPSAAEFAQAAGALGLSDTDTIVVYDASGLYSAPRVWWTFKTFGARDVRVLDGGLPAWTRAGYPLEQGKASPSPRKFDARRQPHRVRDMAQVAAHLAGDDAVLVDARSAPRFRGEEAEPRPGVRPGHMPGARNLHYDRLVGSDGRLIPPDEIKQLFEEARVDLSRPVVTTCGSGVTAALLAFGLERIGKEDVAVYDGSWAEWGARAGDRIATGPA